MEENEYIDCFYNHLSDNLDNEILNVLNKLKKDFISKHKGIVKVSQYDMDYTFYQYLSHHYHYKE